MCFTQFHRGRRHMFQRVTKKHHIHELGRKSGVEKFPLIHRQPQDLAGIPGCHRTEFHPKRGPAPLPVRREGETHAAPHVEDFPLPDEGNHRGITPREPEVEMERVEERPGEQAFEEPPVPGGGRRMRVVLLQEPGLHAPPPRGSRPQPLGRGRKVLVVVTVIVLRVIRPHLGKRRTRVGEEQTAAVAANDLEDRLRTIQQQVPLAQHGSECPPAADLTGSGPLPPTPPPPPPRPPKDRPPPGGGGRPRPPGGGPGAGWAATPRRSPRRSRRPVARATSARLPWRASPRKGGRRGRRAGSPTRGAGARPRRPRTPGRTAGR